MTVKRLDSVIQGRNLLLEAQGNEQVKKEKLMPAYERFIKRLEDFGAKLRNRGNYKYSITSHDFEKKFTHPIDIGICEGEDHKAERDYVIGGIVTLVSEIFPEDETKASNLKDFLFFKSFGNKKSEGPNIFYKGPNIFYNRMLAEKRFPSTAKLVEEGFNDRKGRDEYYHYLNTAKEYVEKLRDKGLNQTEKAIHPDVSYKIEFLETKKSKIEREATRHERGMEKKVDFAEIEAARKKALEDLKKISDFGQTAKKKETLKERLEIKDILKLNISKDLLTNLPENAEDFKSALKSLENKILQYGQSIDDTKELEKYQARIARVDQKIQNLMKPAKGEEPQVDRVNNDNVEPKDEASKNVLAKTDQTKTSKTPTSKTPTPKSPTSKTKTPKKRTFSTELKAFFSALIRKIKALFTACFKPRKPKTAIN